MLRQEAWRRFTTCRLENGDTIDVFIDRLEWIGGRVGMSNHDLSFKAQIMVGHTNPATNPFQTVNKHINGITIL